MPKKWTVTHNLKEFNRALADYTKRYRVDLGEMIKYTALGAVGDIQMDNPVRYGQSRAGWLPFFCAIGGDAELRSATGVDAQKASQKQREGLWLCKYKFRFKNTWKPFASVTNRVAHTKYLEYGVRSKSARASGMSRAKAMEIGALIAVSGRSRPGFVRRAIRKWKDAIVKAMETGGKPKG